MTVHPSRGRAGFTLVEALVVTAIIAVLFGLVTSAVMRGLQTAEDARVSAEIQQLSIGINAAFKAQFNGETPPSFIRLRPKMDYNLADPVDAWSWTILSKFWPQAKKQSDGGGPIDWGQTGSPMSQQPYLLQGHQCLAFFLGGARYDNGQAGSNLGAHIGFSSNPINPMDTTNQSRVGPFYEFAADRLTTSARGSFAAYKDPYNPGQPYYYFSAYRSQYVATYLANSNNPNPVEAINLGTVNGRAAFLSPFRDLNNGQFYNPQTFQLVCAGRDGKIAHYAGGGRTPTHPMGWRNGNFGVNQGVDNVDNPREAQDDLCNFHPNKMGIPK